MLAIVYDRTSFVVYIDILSKNPTIYKCYLRTTCLPVRTVRTSQD